MTPEKIFLAPCVVCGTAKEFIGIKPTEPGDDITCSHGCETQLFQQKQTRKRLAGFDAMIGPNLTNTTRDRLPCTPCALRDALDWEPTETLPILLLHGTTGGGKTRIACLALRKVVERQEIMPMIFWPGHFARDTAKHWRNAERGAEFEERLSAHPLVLFDDIDKDKFSERSATSLFAVMDERIRMGRPTVLTMNANGARFSEKFGDPETAQALLRRIREHARAVSLSKEAHRQP